MPQTVEYILGDSNLFTRAHSLRAGEVIDWHTHAFDHGTWIFSGKANVLIRKDETTHVYQLWPVSAHTRKCVVPAGWEHRIEAIDDCEIECVYAHRDAQGRVTQRWQGNREAVA